MEAEVSNMMRPVLAIAALALCLGCIGSPGTDAPHETDGRMPPATGPPAPATVTEAAITTSTAWEAHTTTSAARPLATTTAAPPKPRECRRPYIRDGLLCCMDADGNGLCDQTQPTTTTATTTTLSGFERLFDKAANKTYDAPLLNSTSVNLGYNHPATTTTIENITAAYVNNYNVYFYRGYWNVGGHVNRTVCQESDDQYGHRVDCPGLEPFYANATAQH